MGRLRELRPPGDRRVMIKRGNAMRLLFAGIAMLGTTVVAAAVPLPETVRIGILVDMSGTQSAADGVGSVEAAKMAVEDFGGKVRGKPVEIVGGDHQAKADLSGVLARRWLDEGMAALVGGGASSAALAALEVARQKDRPMLLTSQAAMNFTNEACSEISIHFTYDAYSLAKSIVPKTASPETNSWYFITVNYAGGTSIEDAMTTFIKGAGGKVVGSTRHPFGEKDYSSHLLKAQTSGARNIGMATYQADLTNALKQASEFGIGKDGAQKFAVPLIYMTDVKGMGLAATPPLETGMSFYWDLDDKTRDFAKRFAARMNGQYPEEPHVGTYTAVLHYLKALEKTNDLSGKVTVGAMKEMPVQDFWNKGTKIRQDGRALHPFFVMQLKKAAESKGPYDFFKPVREVAPEDAFQPLSESKCPLVKKS